MEILQAHAVTNSLKLLILGCKITHLYNYCYVEPCFASKGLYRIVLYTIIQFQGKELTPQAFSIGPGSFWAIIE